MQPTWLPTSADATAGGLPAQFATPSSAAHHHPQVSMYATGAAPPLVGGGPPGGGVPHGAFLVAPPPNSLPPGTFLPAQSGGVYAQPHMAATGGGVGGSPYYVVLQQPPTASYASLPPGAFGGAYSHMMPQQQFVHAAAPGGVPNSSGIGGPGGPPPPTLMFYASSPPPVAFSPMPGPGAGGSMMMHPTGTYYSAAPPTALPAAAQGVDATGYSTSASGGVRASPPVRGGGAHHASAGGVAQQPYGASAEGGGGAPGASSPLSTTTPEGLGFSLIEQLRRDRNDDSIAMRIRLMSERDTDCIRQAFENHPRLALELCDLERGNIVRTIFERFGAASCPSTVHMIRRSVVHLCMSQRGCIAIPRVLEQMPPSEPDELFSIMMREADLATLASHRFANFVCVFFAKIPRLATRMAEYFSVNSQLLYLCTHRHASYVVEEVIRQADEGVVVPVIERVIHSADARGLRHDRCGKVVLRAAVLRNEQITGVAPSSPPSAAAGADSNAPAQREPSPASLPPEVSLPPLANLDMELPPIDDGA